MKYSQAVQKAEFALVRWGLAKAETENAKRHFEVGDSIACNLRGVLKNNRASVALLQSLADDVHYRADAIEIANKKG